MPRIVEDIPQDIIREIFSHFSSSLEVYAPRGFPWYLGHICATWRVIFLSMQSQFWKNISLEWPKWRRRRPDLFPLPWYTRRVIEMLRFFLQRNQGSPFSFLLCTVFSSYTEEEAQDINRVLLILVSESTRWQSASMKLRASMLPTLYRVKHNAPVLQSLDLSLSSDDRTDYSVPDLYSDIFKTAPLLSSISVYYLSTWNFNWTSLTFVHLDDAVDNNLLYTALPYAVRLQGLEIDEPILTHPKIPATELIKLPCLIYLKICSSGFLNVLEAPALVDLQIYFQNHDTTPEANIIGFIRRSSCTLLHLSFGFHEAFTVKRLLLHTPDVRYLCLESIRNVADIFTWLSSKNNQVPGPLAHLEAFRIYKGPEIMADDEIERLSQMVTSRTRPNDLHTGIDKGGLKKLAIDEYSDMRISHDALERLEFLCRRLGIEFRYPAHMGFCKFCRMIFSYQAYDAM